MNGLHPQLQEYIDVFERARVEAHELADSLSASQFNWRPAAGSWSVGECIAHLNIVAGAYVPAMRAALSGGPLSSTGRFRYGWLSRKFIESMRPASRRVKTWGRMDPVGDDSTGSHVEKGECLEVFDRWTDEFVELIQSSDGRDVARLKVTSPFLRVLRLPVGAFFEALGQHAIRHVRQAARVVQSPGFPEEEVTS